MVQFWLSVWIRDEVGKMRHLLLYYRVRDVNVSSYHLSSFLSMNLRPVNGDISIHRTMTLDYQVVSIAGIIGEHSGRLSSMM